MDNILGLLTGKLTLLDRLDNFMDSSGSLLLDVVDGLALADPVQAAHYGSLDQTKRPVHIMIV